MEKYDKFFLDKYPCSKTSMLVFEQGHLLSRAIFASVNYLSSALVKENLSYFPFTLPRKTCQGKTCQGELVSVYSQQVFFDKGTCQRKLASVNEALSFTLSSPGMATSIMTTSLSFLSIKTMSDLASLFFVWSCLTFPVTLDCEISQYFEVFTFHHSLRLLFLVLSYYYFYYYCYYYCYYYYYYHYHLINDISVSLIQKWLFGQYFAFSSFRRALWMFLDHRFPMGMVSWCELPL